MQTLQQEDALMAQPSLSIAQQVKAQDVQVDEKGKECLIKGEFEEAITGLCCEGDVAMGGGKARVIISDEEVHQYIAPLWVAVANWVSGHLEWYRGNTRYTQGSLTLEEVTGHLVNIIPE
jgi:hypothetical protein